MKMQTTFVWVAEVKVNGVSAIEHILAQTPQRALELVQRVETETHPKVPKFSMCRLTRGDECWYDADDM